MALLHSFVTTVPPRAPLDSKPPPSHISRKGGVGATRARSGSLPCPWSLLPCQRSSHLPSCFFESLSLALGLPPGRVCPSLKTHLGHSSVVECLPSTYKTPRSIPSNVHTHIHQPQINNTHVLSQVPAGYLICPGIQGSLSQEAGWTFLHSLLPKLATSAHTL